MGFPISQALRQAVQQIPANNYAAKPPNQNMQPPVATPQGKGGQMTLSSQSGQPQMGQPNQYSNTVGPWDNASIGNQNPRAFGSGKGKGA